MSIGVALDSDYVCVQLYSLDRVLLKVEHVTVDKCIRLERHELIVFVIVITHVIFCFL